MRKLSIAQLATANDAKKVDSVVGTSFERSKNSENMVDRSETITPNSFTLSGFSRLVCW